MRTKWFLLQYVVIMSDYTDFLSLDNIMQSIISIATKESFNNGFIEGLYRQLSAIADIWRLKLYVLKTNYKTDN